MSKTEKRLKPRLPRGFADRAAADIRASERMMATIKSVYERYGFEPVETPLVEYTETLGKFLPDQDRPNEGVFSWQEQEAGSAPPVSPEASPRTGSSATGKQGDWLSLRYDLTAPLARYVAENWERLPKPYRSYRAGWVFRNEKPGPGRFRQFMQFDADTVGSASPAADAEMCMMMADVMEALGIPREAYMIRVNSRKILDGALQALGIEEGPRRLSVLRALDKLDRLGVDGVNRLLGPGREDESGDYTKGAELTNEQIARLEILYNIRDEGRRDFFMFMDREHLLADDAVLGEPSRIMGSDIGASVVGNPKFLELYLEKFGDNALFAEGVSDLQALSKIARSAGYGTKRIRIDLSVVRGLEYYTGAVFEAELLAEIPNEKGQPVVFGSVGGGGRYDGLVGRFMAEDVPATGFSIGVSRLQAALTALGKLSDAAATGPVVVTVMEPERIGDYQTFVADLRNAGVAAELYLGKGRLGAQMKYADRRNAPLAIIQGEDEEERGVVQIKDLVAGKRAAAAIADNAEWREERPGQVEVPAADLVATVRKMLGRS